jgi:UDP-N-acetylglucosamine acyltransferase
MGKDIHPTAFISPKAIVGNNISVGPFAVIEDNVTLGDNCKIGAHAVVQPYTKLGNGNILHPHVILGDLPQDTRFEEKTVSWLICGDNNIFREGFTAHRSATENGQTLIGSGCFFMNNSHVAHDCKIGDDTIFANNVAIGGFVEVGDKVFMGGNVVAHQFCRIGSYAMIQGTTGLNMDVIPYMLVGGRPARHYKLNTIGIRRAGISGERYNLLSTAFRRIRIKQSLEGLEETPEIKYLKDWLAVKSSRGTHGFIDISSKTEKFD